MPSAAMSGVARAETAALNVLPKSQQAGFMKALSAYAEALDKLADGDAPKARTAKKKAAKKKAPARKKTRRGRR